MSRKSVLARTLHKWFALVIGVQALLWFISGAYMTIVPLEIIHGDHLEHQHRPNLEVASIATLPGMIKVEEVRGKFTNVELTSLLNRPVAKLTNGKQHEMIDLQTGNSISPLSRDMAMAIARAGYTGKSEIASVRWITKAPQEVARRPVPMWSVQFDDVGKTTFYIAPGNGEVLARRHTLWRIFDFVWMFHIMDYENRVDVHNNLLRAAIILAMLMTASGIWLLLYSFNRRRAE